MLQKITALLNAKRDLLVQFLKFGTVGVVGFVVDTAVVYACVFGFGWDRIWSGLLAFPVAATATWLGNRLFTFKGQNNGKAVHQLGRFLMVTAVGFVLNRGTYALLIKTVPLVYEYPVLGLLAGVFAGMFFNFFFARKLVFR